MFRLWHLWDVGYVWICPFTILGVDVFPHIAMLFEVNPLRFHISHVMTSEILRTVRRLLVDLVLSINLFISKIIFQSNRKELNLTQMCAISLVVTVLASGQTASGVVVEIFYLQTLSH